MRQQALRTLPQTTRCLAMRVEADKGGPKARLGSTVQGRSAEQGGAGEQGPLGRRIVFARMISQSVC